MPCKFQRKSYCIDETSNFKELPALEAINIQTHILNLLAYKSLSIFEYSKISIRLGA